MLKKIVVIGSGGHFKVVLNEILKQNKYEITNIVDIRNIGKKIKIRNKCLVVKDLKKFDWNKTNKNTFTFIAIGDNQVRKGIAESISRKKTNIKWATIISPDSIIGNNVKINFGTLVVSGSIINPGSKIGKHCIINTNSSIDHDNLFQDFSSCAPGVITGGNVKVGKLSFLGIRSTIINNIKIGSETIIGAKSLVNKDCISNYIYYGLPAKKIKKNKKTL